MSAASGSNLMGPLSTFAVTYATTGVPAPGTWLLMIAGAAARGPVLRQVGVGTARE
jgi:hypothetical protein